MGIIAYNDPERLETRRHLFALSSREFRIHVVALEDYSAYGDVKRDDIPGFGPRWHRYTRIFGGPNPVGAWPARANLSKAITALGLTANYNLSLDAHTRCASRWDRWLVDLYNKAPLEWLGGGCVCF